MRANFKYLRPKSPEDAVKMKAEHGARARCWAGGTDMTLNWQRGKVDLDFCIDLTFLKELDYIECEANEIRIGALTSLATLERSGERHSLLKMLSDVAKLMCTPQTRTIATVGGNLCNASPAADLSPALIAINASAKILGSSGYRTVSLEDFFVDAGKTRLADDEILTEVSIPLPDARIGACYRRIDRSVVDIALVSAASSITVDEDNQITETRIALGAVAPVVIRARDAESELVGLSIDGIDAGTLEKAGETATRDANPISDVRASAEYRQAMVAVMVKRSLEQAINNLGGPAK